MKKKWWLIAALCAALALIVSGCGGGGDDSLSEDVVDIQDIFSGTKTSQDKANVAISKDTVTFSFTGDELWGELVMPEETPWDVSDYIGIKFEYKSTGNATIFVQDTDSIFIFATEGDGWAAINQASNWEALTLPFSSLQRQTWFGTSGHTFNKAAIIKLCFQILVGDDAKKFEIKILPS